MHAIMRSLFKNTSISKTPTRPVVSTFLHEYQSDGPKRHDSIFCIDYNTKLIVVFDGETQRCFSSVRIVLYCDTLWMNDQHTWGIRQLEPATQSRGHVHHAPPSDPALPQLTVAFEVIPRCGARVYYHIAPRLGSSDEKPRSLDSKSVCILLESKHSITPDTLFLSVAFEHSNLLRTTLKQVGSFCGHNINPVDYVTTRTVRVIPMGGARPRITICCLPMELLLKIFEATNSCEWQHDLLSYAQVCRQWSCSMRVLFARLESPEWKNHCTSLPTQSLDPCALAKALSKTPALGLGVQDLHLDQHNGSWDCWNHATQKTSPGFSPALIAILCATKNLQRLHLSQGYSSHANALFSALPELPHLYTLSITRTGCRFSPVLPIKYWNYTISTVQLARCMARWPALTSLTVGDLEPGNIGMRRFFLRPLACALTQLCIRNSHMSDTDLLYLTASSANTLAQVTFDDVRGITPVGLHTFLDSISQQVTSLTIRDAAFPPRRKEGLRTTGITEHALDVVVDKMRCLEALDISGDVASERMLRRRSEIFTSSCGSGAADNVPVVRLSAQVVPGLRDSVGDEAWPGWQVVEFH